MMVTRGSAPEEKEGDGVGVPGETAADGEAEAALWAIEYDGPRHFLKPSNTPDGVCGCGCVFTKP